MPKNGVRSCVHFCLRSHGPLERCVNYRDGDIRNNDIEEAINSSNKPYLSDERANSRTGFMFGRGLNLVAIKANTGNLRSAGDFDKSASLHRTILSGHPLALKYLCQKSNLLEKLYFLPLATSYLNTSI